jgi:hypothetical protein
MKRREILFMVVVLIVFDAEKVKRDKRLRFGLQAEDEDGLQRQLSLALPPCMCRRYLFLRGSLTLVAFPFSSTTLESGLAAVQRRCDSDLRRDAFRGPMAVERYIAGSLSCEDNRLGAWGDVDRIVHQGLPPTLIEAIAEGSSSQGSLRPRGAVATEAANTARRPIS